MNKTVKQNPCKCQCKSRTLQRSDKGKWFFENEKGQKTYCVQYGGNITKQCAKKCSIPKNNSKSSLNKVNKPKVNKKNSPKKPLTVKDIEKILLKEARELNKLLKEEEKLLKQRLQAQKKQEKEQNRLNKEAAKQRKKEEKEKEKLNKEAAKQRKKEEKEKEKLNKEAEKMKRKQEREKKQQNKKNLIPKSTVGQKPKPAAGLKKKKINAQQQNKPLSAEKVNKKPNVKPRVTKPRKQTKGNIKKAAALRDSKSNYNNNKSNSKKNNKPIVNQVQAEKRKAAKNIKNIQQKLQMEKFIEHQKKMKNFNSYLIAEEELKRIVANEENKHLSPTSKHLKRMKKYQNEIVQERNAKTKKNKLLAEKKVNNKNKVKK